MSTSRFGTPLLLSIAFFGSAASAAPPSFHETASPEGWTIVKGQAETGLRSEGGKPLEIRTTAPLALPVEATLRFRAAAGDTIAVQAVEEDASATPLLECEFAMQAGNQATIIVKSSGVLMATVGKSAPLGLSGQKHRGDRLPVALSPHKEPLGRARLPGNRRGLCPVDAV